jgi:APA family basic amino acid/polyamine antiporter
MVDQPGSATRGTITVSTTLESISSAITRRKPLTPLSSPRQSSPKLSRRSDSSNVNEDTALGTKGNEGASASLKRTLGVTDLIFYGIGCSVGAGIYSLVGIGAKTAGPAISLSFALCGIACCFTSLGYAEFAARVPLAGSAYTFTYVSFGELAGWLVGWNLTLGYAVSAAAVSRSWAVYVAGFFHGWLQGRHADVNDEFGVEGEVGEPMPSTFGTSADELLQWLAKAPFPNIIFGDQDYECCPLAAVVILLCTSVLVTGAKESSRFNTVMTILNLTVLGFVVVTGWTTGSVRIHDNLLTPSFFPAGFDGVGRAAGLVFFSYLGFDMVSCLSEEVKNPERNMPIGIVGSLVASSIVYCVVSLTVVGMAPIELLGEDVPIVNALLANACCTHDEQLRAISAESDPYYDCLSYSSCEAPLANDRSDSPFIFSLLFNGSRAVSCGAIFGLTTATFACLMGQPRIFFSMAQDGLLFKIYGQVNPDTGVPIAGTIITGITTAFVACFFNLESLANTISLGTLQVFTFVNAGVIILRMSPPLTPEIGKLETDKIGNAGAYDQSDEKVETSHPDEILRCSIRHERSRLIPPASKTVDSSNQRNTTSTTSSSTRTRSSLLPDEGGAVLVKESRDLNHSSLFIDNGGNSGTTSGKRFQLLEQNGSKPHLLTLAFTIFAVLSSMGVSHSWPFWLIITIVSIMFLSAYSLWQLPQSSPPDTFSCPCVPAVPLLGIFCNSYMMGSMPLSTWYVIAMWLFVGVCFYFSYGIHHSELRKTKL